MAVYPIDDCLREKLKPGISQLRLIVGSLAVGVLVYLYFAVVAWVMGMGEPMTGLTNLFRCVAIGTAPLAFFASRALSAAYVQRACRKFAARELAVPHDDRQGETLPGPLAELGNAGKMFCVYQTQTIVAVAVLEGAALMCVAAFCLTGSLAALALALALVAAIISLWPTAPAVAEWIERQLRLADSLAIRRRRVNPRSQTACSKTASEKGSGPFRSEPSSA
jgi:hypothetical protein